MTLWLVGVEGLYIGDAVGAGKGKLKELGRDGETAEGGPGAVCWVFSSCRALSWGKWHLETSGAVPSSLHGHPAAVPGHQTCCPAHHIVQNRPVSTFDLFPSPFFFQRNHANMR